MSPDHPPALPTLLSASDLNVVRSRTFDEIAIGGTATILRTLASEGIQLFVVSSGDVNPQCPDADLAASIRFHGVIAHGMLGGALISALLRTHLPGSGTIYFGQTLQFLGPVRVDDTLTIQATVVSKEDASKRAMLTCMCTDDSDMVAIAGEVKVIAPAKRIECLRTTLPDVRITTGSDGMYRLLNHVRPLGAVRMTIVHPCDTLSLTAVMDAHAGDLIVPCPVTSYAKLMRVAADAGFDLSDIETKDMPHSCAAVARAVELVTQGRAEMLMKGNLHTDELMAVVARDEAGLRTKCRISHCSLVRPPAYPRPFIVTDAATNTVLTLNQKTDIVRNAIDLAHVVGVERPWVAIFVVVEAVSPCMPTTLGAAVLCKTADRGQTGGGVLDGLLALDSAVSTAAARIKGLVSEVAEQADVLMVPDLRSGSVPAKQLGYPGRAVSTGIVLGARVPIVLTSRAGSRESRIAPCALTTLLAHRCRNLPL